MPSAALAAGLPERLPMTEDAVSRALLRLSGAIDRLEAASLRLRESERIRMNLETELALMRDDRRSLADALDKALAGGEDTRRQLAEMAPRLDRAIEAVQAALQDLP